MVPGYSSPAFSIGTDFSSGSSRTVLIVHGNGPIDVHEVRKALEAMEVAAATPRPIPPEIRAAIQEQAPQKKSWQREQRELPKFLREKSRYR